MHRTLETFLNNGNEMKGLKNYDFKNESDYEKEILNLTSIQFFIEYRSHPKSKECDICLLADDIYKKLWGWCYKNRYENPNKITFALGDQWSRYSADTMNSFKTTYNQAKKIYLGNIDEMEENINLQRYANLTHTIGNFTLVPFKMDASDKFSFNQSRGISFGKYFVYDYFDLSLKTIREKVSEDVFKEYINFFILNDYVYEDFRIKPLMGSHVDLLNIDSKLLNKKLNMLLPQNIEELNDYLVTVNNLIEKRSERIIEILERKNKISKFV